MKRKLIFLVFLFTLSQVVSQTKVEKIWPSLAPGSELEKNLEYTENERIFKVYQPELRVFIPKEQDSKRPAVLICPGGGYGHLAIVKEGIKTAEWLNSFGITAFVLKYRLNESLALDDARRAIRFIRAKSNYFNIDSENIGIIGFSAGGHLAANLVINPISQLIIDEIDKTNSTPNFLIEIYGWLQNLYQKVSKNCPPTFLIHTSDDARVPVEESVNFYNSLIANNIPVEMHIFESGRHGFGLNIGNGREIGWTNLCIDWMRNRGFISK